jgi:hypothetical protein
MPPNRRHSNRTEQARRHYLHPAEQWLSQRPNDEAATEDLATAQILRKGGRGQN